MAERKRFPNQCEPATYHFRHSPPRPPSPTPDSATIRANKWVRLQKEMTFLGGGHLSDRIRLKCVFCPRAFRQQVLEINKKKGIATPFYCYRIFWVLIFISWVCKIGSSVIIIGQRAQQLEGIASTELPVHLLKSDFLFVSNSEK